MLPKEFHDFQIIFLLNNHQLKKHLGHLEEYSKTGLWKFMMSLASVITTDEQEKSARTRVSLFLQP